MQPTSSPARPSGDPSAQPGYAPIAWTAVAALVLAIGFAVLLVGLAVGAYAKGVPLSGIWLPFVPALVVVLAFVARRQIRASEGTRTGEVFANAAWWVAVVSGLGFVGYQAGVNFTVQKDAEAAAAEWAKPLADLNSFDPKDPNLYAACWHMLPPGARGNAPNPARIEQAFGDQVNLLRHTDVVRIGQRNRGALTFTPRGLKEWAVKAGEIGCVLSAGLTCPEGVYGLELPMRAEVDDRGVRRWQVMPPPPAGYVKSATLSPAGWRAAALEADAQAFGKAFLQQCGQPGGASLAAVLVDPRSAEALALVAAAGPLTSPEVQLRLPPRDRQPLPPGWSAAVGKGVFARPDGSPHGPAEVEKLLRAWTAPGQVATPGTLLRGSPDMVGVLAVSPEAVELRQPVEINPASSGQNPAAFRGRLVFQLAPADAAAVRAELAAAPTTGLSDRPPEGFEVVRRAWRFVRLETDMKLVQTEQPRQAPGMPGMGGG